jgi:hypothetical protein
MPYQQREIYHSENGDWWPLCRDDGGLLYKAIIGGNADQNRTRKILERGNAGPEHQALAGLIGSLIDEKCPQR